MPKLSRSAPKAKKQAVMEKTMHKFKHGTQRSGPKKKGKKRPIVKSRKQAIAIGLSKSGQSKYDKGKRVGRK